MTADPRHRIRPAGPEDTEIAGRLLHDFNLEFGDPTPEPPVLAERLRGLIAGGDTAILLGGVAGQEPEGIAVLRFRQSIWAAGEECYLAELYVVPPRRGHGLGRALMVSAIEAARARGATYMDLGTSEDDHAARSLYESLGFSNREGRPDGPRMYVYEREL